MQIRLNINQCSTCAMMFADNWITPGERMMLKGLRRILIYARMNKMHKYDWHLIFKSGGELTNVAC